MTTETNKTAEVKNRKKLWTAIANVAFWVINAVIVAVLVIVEDRSGNKADASVVGELLRKNWYFAVIIFLLYFVIVAADTVVFAVLIKKSGTSVSPLLPVKVSLIGRYYDRITLWSIGGEPMQIATLAQGGLTVVDSGTVTMSRHIVRFFTTAIAVIIILPASRITANVYVMVAAILSVVAGLIVPSFMLLCAFCPKIGLKIGEGGIKLLHKLKIVKDYDKQREKTENAVNRFLNGIKYLSTNKLLIVLIAISAIVELFINNGLPFFVIRSLGNTDVTFWHTFVLCIFVNYAASFAPTPGGAGIAELSFYAIFAAYIEDGLLFWAILLWRISIFFMPVVIGFVTQSVESVRNIIKAKGL